MPTTRRPQPPHVSAQAAPSRTPSLSTSNRDTFASFGVDDSTFWSATSLFMESNEPSPRSIEPTTKKTLRTAASMPSPLLARMMPKKTHESRTTEPATPPPLPPPHASLDRAHSFDSARNDRETKLDPRWFVPPDQWIAHSERKSCLVCVKDFGVLRKKHTCRMCGEVVCSRCSVFKSVNLPIGESKARVCSRCIHAYRQRQHHVQNARSVDESLKPPYEGNDEDEDVTLAQLDRLLVGRSASTSTSSSDSSSVAPPVALLSPDMLASMHRETRAAHSIVLLSPSHCSPVDKDQSQGRPSSAPLRLDDLASSFASTVSSSASLSRLVQVEEELAATLRARELEQEVELSRQRIAELERRMQEQETQKATLSLEQHGQLSEARAMIAELQRQLAQQEQTARAAAATRDSICLSHLRQTIANDHASPPPPPPAARGRRSPSIDEESETLRQKLRLLERQLQQAGINVAELIPYAVAKRRIAEISQRMGEISASLEDATLAKPTAVALRREYFLLEQDMERFHTALLMSDEYLEEQARLAREWEARHATPNADALRLVRSSMPVDIARLSEHALRVMPSPTGRTIPADLARRFKRTNVLQLLRVAPTTIQRMHPSVIESYRTTGLCLLERRALHAALQGVAREWKKQERDDACQRKATWFQKLKDALETALRQYEQHEIQSHTDATSVCRLVGRACPVRAEAAITALYGSGMGFPESDVYEQVEVVKSEVDNERVADVIRSDREVSGDQQRRLKAHYGSMRVREVAMAMGAIAEVDALLERMRALDQRLFELLEDGDTDDRARVWERVVVEAREFALSLARRAGICLTGKRDRQKDSEDTRSPLEAGLAQRAVLYLLSLVDDLESEQIVIDATVRSRGRGTLLRIRELTRDVDEKNRVLVREEQIDGDRKRWNERERGQSTSSVVVTTVAMVSESARADAMTSERSPLSLPLPPVAALPRGALLLDAIRAKRAESSTSAENTTLKPTASDPSESQKPTDLLAAIRARKAKANRTSVCAPTHSA